MYINYIYICSSELTKLEVGRPFWLEGGTQIPASFLEAILCQHN